MGCGPSLSRTRASDRSYGTEVTDEHERSTVCDNKIFTSLNLPASQKCKIMRYIEHMEKAANIPYIDTHGLLLCFQKTLIWPVYLHFTAWQGPVTAQVVDNILASCRQACSTWLSKMKGFDTFTMERVSVKLFGICLMKGVDVDDSFNARYGNYPIVQGWKRDTETSPWKVTYRGRPYDSQDYYDKSLDFSQLAVSGNRSVRDVSFHPKEWAGFVHPEGLKGFYTKIWVGGSEWKAVAQRQYLRIGGVIQDYATGSIADRYPVLLHEMGHCFFLDDLYDSSKYPTNFKDCQCVIASKGRSCACSLEKKDSVMYNTKSLTSFDHAMIRRSWMKQREAFSA